jgi:hypothetical protein
MSASYYANLGYDTLDWNVAVHVSKECTASIFKVRTLGAIFQIIMQGHKSQVNSMNQHHCDILKSYKSAVFTKFSEGQFCLY